MKLKFYDWAVPIALAAIAFTGGADTVWVAVVTWFLYLGVRYLVFSRNRVEPSRESDQDNEFLVHDSQEHDVADQVEITLDVGLNCRPAPGHFCVYSRFDLESGRTEYEYKIEGTSIWVRLLHDYHDGESTNFKVEWEIRDGVVLESDIRARFEASQFKWHSIDEKIADMKKSTEWQVLAPWGFNGFSYFLLNRKLSPPDARRYLRGEIERLKLGNAQATKEIAKYGLEPDPDPKSSSGWRFVGGQQHEGVDATPFWEKVRSGAFGVGTEEVGQFGQKLIKDLQRLIGDLIHCAKCKKECLNTDKFCPGCGTRIPESVSRGS